MMTSLLIRWLGCKIIISIISYHNCIGVSTTPASYAKLIKWWAENNKNTTIYWEGSYKINSDSDKNGSIQMKYLTN
jgi:mevalonate pyrophosphate decarboxylase